MSPRKGIRMETTVPVSILLMLVLAVEAGPVATLGVLVWSLDPATNRS